VVAACLYGNSPDVVDAVDAGGGVTTFVAIPSATRCSLHRPQPEDKFSTSKGDGRAKRGGGAPLNAPSAVAAGAASLRAARWYQRTGSEGPKGPMTYALPRQRVPLWQDGRPARAVWLVRKRT
jgi:hypothetical protein